MKITKEQVLERYTGGKEPDNDHSDEGRKVWFLPNKGVVYHDYYDNKIMIKSLQARVQFLYNKKNGIIYEIEISDRSLVNSAVLLLYPNSSSGLVYLYGFAKRFGRK